MTPAAVRVLTVGCLFLCSAALSEVKATACECISPPVACVAVQRADAVFVGRVTGFTDGVQFDVERPVVGVQRGSITVGNGPGNCAFGFTVGGHYVVYPHQDRDGRLVTGMCTRTRPLSDPHTRADIGYFDRRERNSASGLLTGVVSDVTIDLSSTRSSLRPLARIPITVLADGGSSPARTTTTRDDGSYELAGLPPGRVRVAASFPKKFEPLAPSTEVIVDVNGCAEADIAGRIDGRIRGQLLDGGGRPARGIAVQLADAAAARARAAPLPTMTELTDEEGTFEFRYVNVGRYIVGVELNGGIRPGKLNRRRFYPNSISIDLATVVTLGAGQHLQLPAFRLAPLPSDRVITVVVHAPSDEVASAAGLFLTGAQREPVAHGITPLPLTLPFGARYLIEVTAPVGYKTIQPSVVESTATTRIESSSFGLNDDPASMDRPVAARHRSRRPSSAAKPAAGGDSGAAGVAACRRSVHRQCISLRRGGLGNALRVRQLRDLPVAGRRSQLDTL